MIAYFDTSALIPLLVEEPGSEVAGRLWDEAGGLVANRLVYAEGRAALAQAVRMGRLGPEALAPLVADFDRLYAQIDLLDVDDSLVRRAGDLAEGFALRGYDAVHLASAERVADSQTVLVAGDEGLCRAAGALGIAVASTGGGS